MNTGESKGGKRLCKILVDKRRPEGGFSIGRSKETRNQRGTKKMQNQKEKLSHKKVVKRRDSIKTGKSRNKEEVPKTQA